MQEPFGQIRQDHVVGSLIQVVAGYLSGEPLTLDQVLPRYVSQSITEQDRQEQIRANMAQIDAWVASGKVVDLRKRRKDQ